MKLLELPIELQDEIFLHCDFNLLENTRCYQSNYVKKSTQYFSFDSPLNRLNLRWLFYKSIRFGIYMKDRVFLLACINCDIPIIRFIFNSKIKMYYQNHGFNSIVSQGNLKNVKLLHSIGVKWDEKAINTSIKKNYLDIAQWLMKDLK